ncbi:MAG: hypothetical protein ACD_63C00069G0002 [uncultured bacterium]|nr:MAG: hypothetical protein ACD_63C00069G0002 [uncultured bacterium]
MTVKYTELKNSISLHNIQIRAVKIKSLYNELSEIIKKFDQKYEARTTRFWNI